MNKLAALAKLTRIEHSLMLIVAVVAGELLAGGIPPIKILLLGLITPFFVSMSAFAINDYFDVKADTVNKRLERPLVSGALSKKEASAAAILFMFVGLVASFFISTAAFTIAVAFGVLGFLYSYKLKDIVLIGNIYVAFTYLIPFVYGSVVVSGGVNFNIILISFIVFLAGLAREIHGMVRDIQGDALARKTQNLVKILGAYRSSSLAFILYMESIALSFYLFFFRVPFQYNLVYILPVLAGNLMFFYVARGYLIKNDRKFFDFARNISLLGMGVGLLGYLGAALVYIYI